MLTPTRISYLLTLALLAGGVGWLVTTLWPLFFGQAFATPWLTALTMWVLAAALLIWTLLARKKIKPEKGKPRLDPLLAARSAALAMASSRVGSIALGFYLAVFAENLLLENSPASRTRVFVSALTALASLLTVAIGLWLERLCRLPKPPIESADPSVAS